MDGQPVSSFGKFCSRQSRNCVFRGYLGKFFYQLYFCYSFIYSILLCFYPSLVHSSISPLYILSSSSSNLTESKFNSIQYFCRYYNHIILPGTSHIQSNITAILAQRRTPTVLALTVSKHTSLQSRFIALHSMMPQGGLQGKGPQIALD